MKRRIVAAAVLPMLTALLLVGSALPAGAAVHPVAGTYQWYVQGSPAQTVVLVRNHTVAAPGSGTWSVAKHVVTVDAPGAPAGAVPCLKAGQPPNCSYSAVSTGPRTPTGIAGPSSPGTWTGYIGSDPVVTASFYAVRTGP